MAAFAVALAAAVEQLVHAAGHPFGAVDGEGELGDVADAHAVADLGADEAAGGVRPASVESSSSAPPWTATKTRADLPPGARTTSVTKLGKMRGSESSPSSMAPISSEKVLATRLRW